MGPPAGVGSGSQATLSVYRLAKLLAAASYVVVGVWGLLLCVRFVLGGLGVAAAVAAGLLFPLTLAVVPWVAVVTDGTWPPLLVVYGGMFGAGLLHAAARAMERGAEGSEGDPEGRRPGDPGG